ncbi:MAG: DinB family protein [Phycisphaerales bacterium]|nr:DinB family protein [Phycisphaerales bacterium]
MEFRIEQAVEVLRNTPSVLRSMLSGLGDSWVHNNYGDKTFSPFDVVGHLIHGERTDWIPRARVILEHGETRPFEPFDRYAMYEASRGLTMAQLLDTFESLRVENLEALSALRLTRDQLSLRGTHPALGPVTLEALLAMWTVHDLNHIAQIAKSMAYQYRERVGPWLEYASILR